MSQENANREQDEQISFSEFDHLFPIVMGLDSTVGQKQFQPSEHHDRLQRVLKVLEMLLRILFIPLILLFVLFVYFNFGILAAVVAAVAVLYARTRLPTNWTRFLTRNLGPQGIDLHLHKDGGISLHFDDARIKLDQAGPIWDRDGIFFIVIHDYEWYARNLKGNDLDLLLHLESRLRTLGFDTLDAMRVDDSNVKFIPGRSRNCRDQDQRIRNILGNTLFESLQRNGSARAILLGHPYNRKQQDKDFSDALAVYNMVALAELAKRPR